MVIDSSTWPMGSNTGAAMAVNVTSSSSARPCNGRIISRPWRSASATRSSAVSSPGSARSRLMASRTAGALSAGMVTLKPRSRTSGSWRRYRPATAALSAARSSQAVIAASSAQAMNTAPKGGISGDRSPG